MKTALFIIAMTAATMASGFCEGWRAGYKAGYCYGEYYCIAPIAPLCPIPDIGERSYMDGYERGFLVGMSDK